MKLRTMRTKGLKKRMLPPICQGLQEKFKKKAKLIKAKSKERRLPKKKRRK